MTDLQIKAVIAGIGFGIWPLLMSRSGLNGNVMAAVYGVVCLVLIIPFAMRQGMNVEQVLNANWWVIVPAGVIGTIGLLSFNGGLAKANAQELGTFFVLMVVVQIVVPAIYHVVQNGVSVYKMVGFTFAGLAAYFLAK